MGLVTAEQIRRRVVKTTKLTDAEYIEMYRAKSIVTPAGCLLWQGWCQVKGYGQAGYRNKTWTLHRLIYTLKVGPIPPGMLVCHTCDRPNCWNEDHLFLGTEADNNRDCGNKGRHHNSVKTHCKRGHEFTFENTYLKIAAGTVMRACKECQRLRCLERYRKDPEAARRKRQEWRAKIKARRMGASL
jgi:hypothetical protein